MVGPNVATPPTRQETATPDWAMAEVQEFVPQQFETSSHSHMVGFYHRWSC
jgi:PAB-dependent poly(A)-specific ribonuclease subunit 3